VTGTPCPLAHPKAAETSPALFGWTTLAGKASDFAYSPIVPTGSSRSAAFGANVSTDASRFGSGRMQSS